MYCEPAFCMVFVLFLTSDLQVAVSVYSDAGSDRDDELHLCQISPTVPPTTAPLIVTTHPIVTPQTGALLQEEASSGDHPLSLTPPPGEQPTVLSGLNDAHLPTAAQVTDPPSLAVVYRHREISSPANIPQREGAFPQLQESTDFTPSLSIDAIDPPTLQKLTGGGSALQSQRGGASKWTEASTSTRGRVLCS